MVELTFDPAEARDEAKPSDPRRASQRRLILSDKLFKLLTRASAIFGLLILFGVIVTLVEGSIPAFQQF